MLNRRSVLKLGAAGMAGVLADVPIRSAIASDKNGMQSLFRAVYDERFDDARAFAAELHHRDVRVSGIRSDVAKLWYDDLRRKLRRKRAPVAGLTDRVALFCLEELMRDVGMKTRCRIDHLIHRNGFVEHRAAGPSSLTNAVQNLAPMLGFGRTIATVAELHSNAEPTNIGAVKRSGPFSPTGKTALVSWIIA